VKAAGRGRRTATVTASVSALIVVAQVAAERLWPYSPKRGLGLGFGVFAALVFVAAMAYPARRPRARPFRNAQDWLALHVHLSFVAAVAVLAHAGLRPPRGGMGWLLLALTLLTTASGLLGVYLQKTLPVRTAEGLRTQALYDRIPEHLEALVAEADERLSGAGEALDGLYESEIRPELLRLRPRWAYLQDVRADRDSALLPLQQMAPFVADEDKLRLDDLISLYTQKLELDAQRSVQWALRHWLALHALPGGLLLAVLAVHVFTWLWY
jgi:uncharacterized membrane protein (DUF441 family)